MKFLLSKVFNIIPKELEPGKTYVLLSPHIGDVYAFCSLTEEIKLRYNIKRIVLIVPKKFHQLVLAFKSADELIEIDEKVAEALIWLHFSNPLKIQPIQPGKLNIAHPGLLEKIIVFKGYNFWDLLRLKLGIEEKIKFKLIPKLPEPSDNVIEFEKQYKGHTRKLYIFPSARAFRIPKEVNTVFRKVIELAIFNGWIVFANDVPDYLSDLPLIPARFSLLDVIHFANFTGNVLTLRSGITDLLTNSTAKVAVLYPNTKTGHLFGKTNIKDYFPISDFETVSAIKEFIISDDSRRVINEIAGFFNIEY
uniref:ADP-heptose:LPS heptosyltransferase n=1 Tax=Fervidobacterium pennivorans TaxID=93466 RepID=A0A7V4NFD3_FERPE